MPIPFGNSAMNDSIADDAHPIQPFHQILRGEKFAPSHSEHTDTGRVNHYKRPNDNGGEEHVELHHDRGSGKIMSITKSGAAENVLSHSVNSSPSKMHRNIHEASYRAPANAPKPFTAGQVREYQGKISAPAGGEAKGE